MNDSIDLPDQNLFFASRLRFDEEIYIEAAGFSFQPLVGFELEVNGSVYMYSEDGNMELCMIGGALKDKASLAELNSELAANFMINFDEFNLVEAGKEALQGVTGLVNEIFFNNAEEEGLGRSLICSPHINQFFFLLLIASADHWQKHGSEVFTAIKDHVHFHAQFTPAIKPKGAKKHRDLIIESIASVHPEEKLIVSTLQGDLSILLATRTSTIPDEITLIEIVTPNSETLYRFKPETGSFSSQIFDQPLLSSGGELCLLLPFPRQQNLQTGTYQFTFATKSGETLQEIQLIIRQGRLSGLQKFDLNLWIALKDDFFNDPEIESDFEIKLRSELKRQLAPMKIVPGQLEIYHAAPDELASFAHINLDTDLADCSYIIAESVENGRALNIGLVDRLTCSEPPNEQEIISASSGSPGIILAPTSPHACILVNFSAFKNDFSKLAQAIISEMFLFCGLQHQHASETKSLMFDPDFTWRLRQHPLFYNAD